MTLQSNDEEESKWAFLKNYLGVFLVMLFTHVLLTATGNISPAGFNWRVLQVLVTLAFYSYKLYEVSHEDELTFAFLKED